MISIPGWPYVPVATAQLDGLQMADALGNRLTNLPREQCRPGGV